jgi:hypothetical protein
MKRHLAIAGMAALTIAAGVVAFAGAIGAVCVVYLFTGIIV